MQTVLSTIEEIGFFKVVLVGNYSLSVKSLNFLVTNALYN